MIHYNSHRVLQNQVFKDELNRFNSRLNSEVCFDIPDNDRLIISELPIFIASAHPFVYKTEHSNYPFFGLRKDIVTAYAAHPLNVCNILLDFGFHDVIPLFQAGFHDNPEELGSLKNKAKSRGLEGFFIDSKDDFLFLNTKLLPDVKKFVNNNGLYLPENFNKDIVSGVKDLTPGTLGWKNDFINFDETKSPYFVKCADTLSVNRDPDVMVSKFKGDIPRIVGKIEERIEKINIIYDKGEEYLKKPSKERSIILAIEDCREFLEEFISEVVCYNGLVDDDVLKNIRRVVQRNHPYYVNTSYGHNKY
jgi:hypothetical protein